MTSPAKRAKPSPAKPPGAHGPEDSAPSEDPVILLRRRWELASVLHFLRVFEPVIKGDLELSAEDIETALVSNNGNLARLHIALLKSVYREFGIHPCDAVAHGFILLGFHVAEGKNPLTADPGNEVEMYKKQDPIQRLLILKALCEVRSEQDDAVRYVNDEMKKGTDISNFRKGKLGSGGSGTIYWYDGDSTIGHRLYTEDVTVGFKKNWKGKDGRLTKPVINIHWETVATNLNEFLEISEKLCKKGRAESATAEYLRTEIIPDVEKLQKKKERALKRQQKKDEILAFANTDYDRSIKEAIRIASKAKEHELHEAGTKEKHALHQGGKDANGSSDTNSEHNQDGQEDATHLSDLSSDDDEDRDYSDNDVNSAGTDGDNNAYDPPKRDLEEEDAFVTRKRTRLAARLVNDKPRQGLRRSQRNVKNNEDTMDPGQLTPQAMTKKTLRQRPTPVSKQPETAFSGSEDDRALTVADSEDESEYYYARIVADSEDESEDCRAQTVADSEDESE
ncbi:hypothetical protein PR202_gb20708 [Eleusine coracana subsp. coracana]|uniref:DDT domain-containing protein n=1 Tax=Eleusine coracana subsp. coracana TaxID=191504 RepID=A0AAV5F968_ELECO|nr:hypothetical protein PR202_gb20708 [Eleusine coracana subsp. coracana]